MKYTLATVDFDYNSDYRLVFECYDEKTFQAVLAQVPPRFGVATQVGYGCACVFTNAATRTGCADARVFIVKMLLAEGWEPLQARVEGPKYCYSFRKVLE